MDTKTVEEIVAILNQKSEEYDLCGIEFTQEDAEDVSKLMAEGKSVFLEEDMDASTFLKEYRFRMGKEPHTKVKNDGDNSPIRSLPSFEN